MSDSQRLRGQPAKIGPYEVVRELGRGAMGVVYLCRQPGLKREVAVKVLGGSRQASDVSRERFRREAKLIARLHHPNVIGVHDAGEDAGRFWYSMDVVVGETLEDAVTKRGSFDARRACELLRDVALAVHALHEAGIVHRDLKPPNVLIEGASGRPLLTDFGLALDVASDDAHRLTKTGVAVGTPLYMAPEQLKGEKGVDRRADVYALGMILYYLLTGHEAFVCSTLEQLVAAILTIVPRPPSSVNREIPRALDEAVLRALSKDREERFATAQELAGALDAIAKGKPGARATGSRSRARLLVPIALACGALLVPFVADTLSTRAARERDEELDRRVQALAAEVALETEKAVADSVSQAREALWQRDAVRAREAARRALERRPEDPRLLALRARTALAEASAAGAHGGQLEEVARTFAARALVAAPGDPFVLITTALVRFHAGDTPRGLDAIRSATEPSRRPTPEDLAEAADALVWHVGPDQAENAVDLASRAIAGRAGVARFHVTRSRALVYLPRRRDEALEDLDKAVRLLPRDAPLRVERARLLQDAKAFASAREDLDVALEIQPGTRSVLAQRGFLLEALDLDADAVRDYDACLAGPPTETAAYWPARLRRGLIRAKKKDFVAAAEDLELACAQAPGADEQVLYALGSVLGELGRFTRAHEVLERAVALLPDSAEPVLRLGASYEKEGALDQARSIYSHARGRFKGAERARLEQAMDTVAIRIRDRNEDELNARLAACKKRLDELGPELVAIAELGETPDKKARLDVLAKKLKEVQSEIDSIEKAKSGKAGKR